MALVVGVSAQAARALQLSVTFLPWRHRMPGLASLAVAPWFCLLGTVGASVCIAFVVFSRQQFTQADWPDTLLFLFNLRAASRLAKTLATMNPQQVIDDARPMLEDVLPQIGLSRSGEPIDLIALRDSFSAWAQAQEVSDADFGFMASLVGAYISEYLIDDRAASIHLLENKIFVRIPFEGGIVREFEPYAAAAGLVRNRQSLSEFLAHV